MSACNITPNPGDLACPFQATPGQVTLEVKDVVGSVEFLTAKYNGASIPGTPAKQITFTVVSGSHDLDVVYTFTDTVNGEGELHEVCDKNTFLRRVHASNAAVGYTICA
jgi:hypothetical protein